MWREGGGVQTVERCWRVAMAKGDLGVWDLAPQLDRVRYSTPWTRRLGFPDGHAAESTTFWRCRVHPDDLAPMLGTIRRHFDGDLPTYECRFRLRSNGSGYRTVLSRGRVVERDDRAQPVRMLGTMIDLTPRAPRPRRAGLPDAGAVVPGDTDDVWVPASSGLVTTGLWALIPDLLDRAGRESRFGALAA